MEHLLKNSKKDIIVVKYNKNYQISGINLIILTQILLFPLFVYSSSRFEMIFGLECFNFECIRTLRRFIEFWVDILQIPLYAYLHNFAGQDSSARKQYNLCIDAALNVYDSLEIFHKLRIRVLLNLLACSICMVGNIYCCNIGIVKYFYTIYRVGNLRFTSLILISYGTNESN